MYKVGIVCTTGNKFLNSKPFYDKLSAKEFQKTCDRMFEGTERFEIVSYCDKCGEKQKKLYAGGLCKNCFQLLQKQSPCYGCKNDSTCSSCWVTRYIIGGVRK